MKKNGFLTGILSIALVFVMALFVGCDDGSGDGGGGGDTGGGNITITISGLVDGTTYYVGPVWKSDNSWSASGYLPKSAVASGGKVTVTYSTDNISNVVGKSCNIAFGQYQNLAVGTKSDGTYTMNAGKVVELTYPGDFIID
jgi:hypothetical protein